MGVPADESGHAPAAQGAIQLSPDYRKLASNCALVGRWFVQYDASQKSGMSRIKRLDRRAAGKSTFRIALKSAALDCGWRTAPSAPMARDGAWSKFRVTVRTREIYRSANGDRWLLARDPDAGRVFVRHEPNLPSGGQVADIEIGAFLIAAGNGPEKQELLRLIGSLV